jgi:hypothetical protein
MPLSYDATWLIALTSGAEMLHNDVESLRKQRLTTSTAAVPAKLQGISKKRVTAVLKKLSWDNADIIDSVFALLDNETPSWFPKAPEGAKFSDGATTAHIGCHIGILQRGNGKLDREGRDYWIKPLTDVGAVEQVTLYSGAFVAGHPVAKSGNSAYRLNEDFVAVLKSSDNELDAALTKWASRGAIRQRHEYQAKVAAEAKSLIDSGHSDLIQAAIKHYVPKFLPGFEVLFVDDGDGDRISKEQKTRLKNAGIEFKLSDAMPDVLLWNPKTDKLWVLEAVTSDGEVDNHKVDQVMKLVERSGKKGVGFTTAYQNWKGCASRQEKNRNLAVNTYIWIQSDPSKQMLVESFV